MKRYQLKKLVWIFIVVICISPLLGQVNVQGAKKFNYTTFKKNYSYKYHGRKIAQANYKGIKIKGKSKAAKKINKDIKKDYKNFNTGWKSLKKMAKMYCNEPEIYSDSVKMKVSANTKKYISIKYNVYSYSGGIHGYGSTIGMTYNKKGEKLTLVNVVKGNDNKIKQKVLKSFRKWNKENNYPAFPEAEDIIQSQKASDMHYYIKGKYAYVCFTPYEIAPYVVGTVQLKVKLR